MKNNKLSLLPLFILCLMSLSEVLASSPTEPRKSTVNNHRNELIVLKEPAYFNPEVTNPKPPIPSGGEYADVRYEARFTTSDIVNREINQSLPFGRTLGNHSVTPSGAAGYSIPIATPPGTNEIAPSLLMSYNSGDGNGNMGMGWSIAGLSKITRGNRDIYHDDAISEIKHQKTDPYLLNGSRLMHMSGTYGAGNSVYSMENESFNKITAIGTNSTGPAWFKVETKEGLTYEYGNDVSSTNSLLYHPDGTMIVWALSRIVDCNGNYVEFRYVNLGNEMQIDEIVYTGNDGAGLSPYNRLKFNYGVRNDKNTLYTKGFGIKQNYLLEEIEVWGENNQLFKKYQFNYNYTDGHSLLRELKEIGSNNSTLNSTIFKYGDVPLGFSYGNTSAGQGDGKDVFSGDYNGDGFSDLLLATVDYITVDGKTYRYHTGYKFFFNNATTGYSFTQGLSNTFNAKIQSSFFDHVSFPASDYNGDGVDDLVSTYIYEHNNWLKIGTIQAYYGKYAVNGIDIGPSISASSFDIIHPSGKFFYPGDYNGDGRGDFITILSNATGYKAFLSLEGGADPNHEILIPGSGQYPATTWVQSDKIYVVDFNGDRQNDLMVIKDGTTTIYTFVKNGSNYDAVVLYSSGFPTKWHVVKPGDFNGDGKTDLLNETNGNWYVSYSTGTGFSTDGFSPSSGFNLSSHKIMVSDYNGDGMSDIMHIFNGQSDSYHQVYLSTGRGFIMQQLTNAGPTLAPGNMTLGDFNGDGRADMIQQDYYNSPMHVIMYKKNGKERLLEKISDGYSYVTEFDYESISEGGSFYTKGSAPSYPLSKIQTPSYTVKKVTIPDGIGGTRQTHYSYEGALVHKQGKGFLGFEKFISKDYDRDFVTTQEFEFNTTYYAGAIKKETTKHISNSAPVSETQYTNVFNNLVNDRFYINVASINTIDHINNRRNTVDFIYNIYGAVLQKTTNIGLPLSGSAPAHEYTHETFSNFSSMCTGIPVMPRNATITTIRNGGAPFTKSIRNYYDPHHGLYKTIDFYGTSEQVVTEHTSFHIHFGNVMSTEVSSSGLPTRSVGYAFDSKGRFPVEETNSLGQKETRTYHPLWGKLLTVTSVDGLTVTNTYDAFGRIATSTAPTSQVKQYSRHWDLQSGSGTGTTTVQNAHYHVDIAIPGFPDRRVFYDILDRKRQSQHMGFNSQWVKTVTSYDKLGRVKSASTPFYNTSQAVVAQYTYDDYDRVKSTSNPSTSTTYNYAFSGTNTTRQTSGPNGSATIETDATGKILIATDQGGTMTYKYNSAGNMVEVRKDGNLLSTLTYDPTYQRPVGLSDIDGGNMAYGYDAFGQLISETDGNGNTHTMTYDALGRLLTKAGPEGTTNYQYVTSGNGLNQIKKITGFNGLTKEYEYDSYNRLMKLSVPYLSGLSTTFGYDSYGRRTNMIYSTDVQIMRNYDASGYVEKVYSVENDVINQQSVLVTVFEGHQMNAFGRYTQYDAGNGVSSNVSYNNYGYPTFYNAGSGAVQYMQLDWNMYNGNLTKRTDHIKNNDEEFWYDSMNRLYSVTVNGSPSLNTTYDPNGNFDWHSNVEHMQYHTTFDDHRIKKIANPNTDISLNTQQTSYTTFDKVDEINEGDFNLSFNYGPDYTRIQSILKENGQVSWVRAYVPEVGYESIIEDGVKKHLHYVPFADKLGVIIIRCEDMGTSGGGSGGGEHPAGGGGESEGLEPSGDDPQPIGLPGCSNDYNYFYPYSDHLGSILTVTNEYGNIIAEQSFDAWGRYRDPDTWAYINAPSGNPSWLIHGYTAHEHLNDFELIHMNARMYAPKTNSMLSPDNYTHGPGTQGVNRYSYAFNNPLKYTDPNGEDPVTVAIIIGAVLGAYTGGTIANEGQANPFRWDYNSGRTWSYMLAGAVVGGASAGLGAQVAGAGGIMAKTLGLVSSSFTGSVGTHIYTGGRTDVTISAGSVSYNIDEREFKTIFSRGNSLADQIGFAWGMFTNASDLWALAKGVNAANSDDVTLNSDNHSRLYNKNGDEILDVGADLESMGINREDMTLKDAFKNFKLTTEYTNTEPGLFYRFQKISGVRLDKIAAYKSQLDNSSKTFKLISIFGGKSMNCSRACSAALNRAGVFNVNTGLPGFLSLQMYAREGAYLSHVLYYY